MQPPHPELFAKMTIVFQKHRTYQPFHWTNQKTFYQIQRWRFCPIFNFVSALFESPFKRTSRCSGDGKKGGKKKRKSETNTFKTSLVQARLWKRNPSAASFVKFMWNGQKEKKTLAWLFSFFLIRPLIQTDITCGRLNESLSMFVDQLLENLTFSQIWLKM